MENPNSRADYWSENNDSASYALSGKIMLSAIVILFAVVVLMVSLHIYARWYLYRTRRRPHTRGRRRNQLVFFLEPPTTAAQCRLDSSILKSLPVFVYSPETHGDLPECAVCLSEFEENEQGRRLPKCNHCFHTGCIDMWFHSHSTCPICRSVVDAETSGSGSRNPGDVVISVAETEDASASALCSTCQQDEGSSSVGGRRKATELAAVSIEVPGRSDHFGLSGDDSLLESPATQVQKSPGGRMLSLKRILSRDRKSMLSPTTSVPSVSCGSVAVSEFEVDLERATDGTQAQPQDSR